MAGKHGWPYWPALVARARRRHAHRHVVELAVIRRLFHAPRVIVLVATIGVAQLCAGGHPRAARLPHRLACRRSSRCRSSGDVAARASTSSVDASQLLVLIVVPLITLGLWWLLGPHRLRRRGAGGGDATPTSRG